jgi:hypothetical protein
MTVAESSTPTMPAGRGPRGDAWAATRVVAAATLVGVACGWLVVGVLSRLAMFVLAELNPGAAGVTSDDGFAIGQFTIAGSLNLMFLGGTFLGLLGAALYVAVRGLTIGPAWFRVASVSLGAGVVVASQVVHADGVDFVLLEPLWLAVGMFVALPILYVAVLSVVCERLLASSWTPTRGVLVVAALPWLATFVLLPLLAVLAVGFLAWWGLQRTGWSQHPLLRTGAPWLARAGLAVVFVLAVASLVADVRSLG